MRGLTRLEATYRAIVNAWVQGLGWRLQWRELLPALVDLDF